MMALTKSEGLMGKAHDNQAGFTLLELMAAIVSVGILVALFMLMTRS